MKWNGIALINLVTAWSRNTSTYRNQQVLGSIPSAGSSPDLFRIEASLAAPWCRFGRIGGSGRLSSPGARRTRSSKGYGSTARLR